jgi:hypothetical protein
MWTLINILQTLGNRSIVKQGTLDYFLITWASKGVLLTVDSNNKVLCCIKNKYAHILKKYLK